MVDGGHAATASFTHSPASRTPFAFRSSVSQYVKSGLGLVLSPYLSVLVAFVKRFAASGTGVPPVPDPS